MGGRNWRHCLKMTVMIYALKDPGTSEIRYIGKANDLQARMREHRWEAKSSGLQTHKVRWLRTLDGDPIVKVLEVCTTENWAERERFWIKRFRRGGVRLTNIADGGQTSPVEGRGHTEETKAKCRAAAIRNGAIPPSRIGQLVSEGTRLKLSQAAIKRGAKPPPTGGWNKGQKKTHCKAGHKLHPENAYYAGGRYRYCKACNRDSQKAYLARQCAGSQIGDD